MIISKLVGVALGALIAGQAGAVTVDGVIGAGEYSGAIVTQVTYDAAAPNLGPSSAFSAYTTYLKADASTVYIAIQTNPAGAGNDDHDGAVSLGFANLYFDTNPSAANGSDVGFEVFNNRAFNTNDTSTYYGPITGVGAQFATVSGTSYVNGGTPGTIEFSVPWSFFTSDPLGIGFTLLAPGAPLQFRTSQSFGYTFAGGPAGTRFGTLNAPGGVPEPASWALLLTGFGMIGTAMRRRSVGAVRTRAAA